MPGLFAPGRSKKADMAFLVQTAAPAPALVAEKKPRARRKVTEVSPPPAPPEELKKETYGASPPRRVPVAPPAPERLSWAEVPGLALCTFGWVRSLLWPAFEARP
jgi:hypothetical protein